MTRSELLTRKILDLLMQGYTQREIAVNLRKHKNTINKHVKLIKQSPLFSIEETVNKIDHRLNNDIPNMRHSDLISYRRTLLPPITQTETRTIVEGGSKPLVVKMWKPIDESTRSNTEVLATQSTDEVSQS